MEKGKGGRSRGRGVEGRSRRRRGWNVLVSQCGIVEWVKGAEKRVRVGVGCERREITAAACRSGDGRFLGLKLWAGESGVGSSLASVLYITTYRRSFLTRMPGACLLPLSHAPRQWRTCSGGGHLCLFCWGKVRWQVGTGRAKAVSRLQGKVRTEGGSRACL